MRRLVNHMRKSLTLLTVVLLLLNTDSVYALTRPFSALEIIAPTGKMINSQAISRIVKSEGLPASSVYQWNNHLVVYGKNLNVAALQKAIKGAYPTCTIKIYCDPFYDFDRKQHCGNTQQA